MQKSQQAADGPRGGAQGMLMRRFPFVLTAIVVVVAVAVGLVWWTSRPRVEDPLVAAQRLADSWSNEGLDEVAWATRPDPANTGGEAPARDIPPGPTSEQVTTLLGDLGPDGSDRPDGSDGSDRSDGSDGSDGPDDSDEPGPGAGSASVVVTSVAPPTDEDPYTATAHLTVTWDLPQDRSWEVATTATLVRHPGELTWAPSWSPTVVHPDVRAGDQLAMPVRHAERGRILDVDGNVVVGPHRVTDVGLHPARVEDLDGVVTAIVDVLDQRLDVQLDPAEIIADVAAADPDHFVSIVTLRNADYQQVEDVVYPLVGTTFRDDILYLGPSSDYAAFTLGSVGPVTAELLDAQPQQFERGDQVGRSGVQEAQDDVLSGTNGWAVVATRAGDNDPTLHEVDPVPGRDIRVALRTDLQIAAQAAIAATGHAASMVVMRPSTGEVLAMANSPEATFDIARTGRVAPGSVSKVITTVALMRDEGITADSPVACPHTVEVGGRTISNVGSLALGDTVFARAFAQSCNTTFVDQSRNLGPSALHDAGLQLGVGADWDLGVDAFAGAVPVTEDAHDLAQAAFGQGRVQANPLAMATMMSSVASGTTVTPRLVIDPAAGTPTHPALPDDVATTLQDLTRLVVTQGSGGAVVDVSGPPVHGKTGTADFVNDDGREAKHVWFAGFQDDLAFAVLVTDVQSGSGGATAAPLAANFLEAIR